MMNDFIALAEEEGVKFNEEEFKRSESLIKMLIKALVGRDTYTNATFFKIYNTEDPIFKEALRLIESDGYQKMLTTPDPLF